MFSILISALFVRSRDCQGLPPEALAITLITPITVRTYPSSGHSLGVCATPYGKMTVGQAIHWIGCRRIVCRSERGFPYLLEQTWATNELGGEHHWYQACSVYWLLRDAIRENSAASTGGNWTCGQQITSRVSYLLSHTHLQSIWSFICWPVNRKLCMWICISVNRNVRGG